MAVNTLNTLDEVVDRITKHHYTFASHLVHRTGTRVWITLKSATDYMRKNPMIVSMTWDAELNELCDGANGREHIKTSITIGVNADGTYNYQEQVA